MAIEDSFSTRVLQAVRTIPRGSTKSYKDIAIMAGSPKAYRAVGMIIAQNYDPAIPCHRVIHADGRLGHYNRGDEKKRQLLIEEGALII